MIDSATLLRYQYLTLKKCGWKGAAMILTPIDPARKAVAETLFRTTDRTVAEIAAETGLLAATLRRWCRQETWRVAPAKTVPAAWSPLRCAALARVDRVHGVSRDDLAVVLGLTRRQAPAYFAACGLAEVPDQPPPGPAALRLALRTHIARQIARFDADLTDAAPGLDSARVLRDLGGLKRLLDDLDAEFRTRSQDARRSDADAEAGAADGPDDDDLPALRAQIAQRYAAFMGERSDAGLPCEPAAPPRPGAGP